MNFLKEIIEVKKEEVRLLKKKYSVSSFKEFELFNRRDKEFQKILKKHDHLSIIAEIKKASPSKGVLKTDFNHLQIAKEYMINQVEAISILTDEKFFKGNINYLSDVAFISSIPVLRKDFLIDEIQIFEAKAFGANAILLISELLSDQQIKDFTKLASELGLDVLLEIHDEDQIEKIDFNLNKLIGINNRDLRTFSVSLSVTERIKKLIPDEVCVVSESGISNNADVDFLKKNKIDAILIGEHLMKSFDIGVELNYLKSWCKIES